ncbi:MAG: HAD-IA family hydrolase [Planctomycetota bacterium]
MPPAPNHSFLDAGNTLVHLDFHRVADILAKEFSFHGDPGAMEQAEPHARLHVDWARLDMAEDRTRWLTYFWTVLSAAGWQDRARVQDAVRALFAVNQTFTLWSRPGRAVAETLTQLKDLGYRLAVISNSDGSVEGMLTKLGLTKHLDYVIDSHVVGVEKPHRRIFDMAIERSGAAAERSLYVGDMFHIDVVGARGAGMDAVLMDPAGLHSERKCRRVREISDLPSHLKG